MKGVRPTKTRRNPETLIKTTAPRCQLQRFVRFCYYVPKLLLRFPFCALFQDSYEPGQFVPTDSGGRARPGEAAPEASVFSHCGTTDTDAALPSPNLRLPYLFLSEPYSLLHHCFSGVSHDAIPANRGSHSFTSGAF